MFTLVVKALNFSIEVNGFWKKNLGKANTIVSFIAHYPIFTIGVCHFGAGSGSSK